MSLLGVNFHLMDTCPWLEEEEKMEKVAAVSGNREMTQIRKSQSVQEAATPDVSTGKYEVSAQPASTDDSAQLPVDLENFINSEHRRQMKETCNSPLTAARF